MSTNALDQLTLLEEKYYLAAGLQAERTADPGGERKSTLLQTIFELEPLLPALSSDIEHASTDVIARFSLVLQSARRLLEKFLNRGNIEGIYRGRIQTLQNSVNGCINRLASLPVVGQNAIDPSASTNLISTSNGSDTLPLTVSTTDLASAKVA